MSGQTNNIHILLVEDDEDDYLLARQRLRGIYGAGLQLEWADSYEKGLHALQSGTHDVCLLDYRLGPHDGLELLSQAPANGYNAPIILMTGQAAHDIDVEAMRAGAADYLVKGQVDASLLERAIRYAIQQKRSEAERLQLIREQAARQQAEEASRLKDEFLAVVSHELKTPLHAIKGWAELLRDQALTPEETRRAIEAIARNARAQQQIIDDLLDVSRIISGKLRLDLRPVSLSSIIHAAVETVRQSAENKELQLTVQVQTLAAPVIGDTNRLQQIIWNLLTNAIKFTPAGGQIKVQATQTGAYAEVVIQDSGQGIAPVFLPHVFDPFRQEDAKPSRKQSGLGLGLSIVRQLVEMHGGTINAYSDGLDQGARFTIRLPLAGDPLNQTAENQLYPNHFKTQDAALQRALHGLRALVVDDELDSSELLQSILLLNGVEVRTANNAEAALALLQEWQPDIIISDIGMPKIDGYELIRRVRALDISQGGQIPAVALTAYARTTDQLRALAAGFQMHIAKPIEPVELLTVIASLSGKMW